ncbi:unnamed protein product, partial [Lymnaea stagnalis]
MAATRLSWICGLLVLLQSEFRVCKQDPDVNTIKGEQQQATPFQSVRSDLSFLASVRLDRFDDTTKKYGNAEVKVDEINAQHYRHHLWSTGLHKGAARQRRSLDHEPLDNDAATLPEHGMGVAATLNHHDNETVPTHEELTSTATTHEESTLRSTHSEESEGRSHRDGLLVAGNDGDNDITTEQAGLTTTAAETVATTSATEALATTSTTEAPETTSATEAPATTSTTEVPATTSTTEAPATTSTTEAPATTSTTEAPA